MNNKHDIVLYQIDDTNVCVSVYFGDETFWLTTKAMAVIVRCKDAGHYQAFGEYL